MNKLKILVINARINFSNLSLLTDNEFNKFIVKHCDKCELFANKHHDNLCGVVSEEVLFLESLMDTLLSSADDIFKNELVSAGNDLIDAVRLFLFERPFKPVLSCDMERHLVLSKLIKISSQISEAVA